MFNSLPVYNDFCHLLIAFDTDSHFWVHTFMETDHEILSTVILLLPMILEVTNERMYVHQFVLVAQEKSG